VTKIKNGFLMEAVTLPLEKILPSRKLKPGVQETSRFKMIEASVREVGIIEPPVVYPQGKSGMYLLLDGHIRLEILRGLGRPDVLCLVSTDDEGCTYNIRVNRLAPIQENRMILKAIADGVSEEAIAKALNVSPKTIRDSRSQLTDICAEAIDALKDKPIADMALRVLKKVKAYRQIEMADLMVMSNTYTAAYARTLLAATPLDQLVEEPSTADKPEQMAKLEVEMRAVERDFVVLEESYSRDTLNLQLARGYLKTLLQNTRVAKYLGQKHGELHAQLQKVVEATSLEGA
jgi:ParB-like chromosome segregation protein Spo0J